MTRRFLLASLGFVAAIALVAGSAALARFDYLQLLLGDDYRGVEILVIALMPKAAIHCLIAIAGARLAGHGYTFYHPAAGVSAFVTLVLVDIVLFQRLGLSAAILGITIAYAVAAGLLAMGARRVTGRASAPLVMGAS